MMAHSRATVRSQTRRASRYAPHLITRTHALGIAHDSTLPYRATESRSLLCRAAAVACSSSSMSGHHCHRDLSRFSSPFAASPSPIVASSKCVDLHTTQQLITSSGYAAESKESGCLSTSGSLVSTANRSPMNPCGFETFHAFRHMPVDVFVDICRVCVRGLTANAHRVCQTLSLQVWPRQRLPTVSSGPTRSFILLCVLGQICHSPSFALTDREIIDKRALLFRNFAFERSARGASSCIRPR